MYMQLVYIKCPMTPHTSYNQGRIEPPEAARGHATSVVGSVDSEM